MARTDDVINVAGHRISTKALEEVHFALLYYISHNNGDYALATMPFLSLFRFSYCICQGILKPSFVIDAACVGYKDKIKGHVPVAFITVDKSKTNINENNSLAFSLFSYLSFNLFKPSI